MQTSRPTSRRTLLRGTAWATPVIAVAATAPAYAATGPVRPQVVLSIDDATMGPDRMSVTVGFANATGVATTELVRLSITFSQLLGSRAFPAEEPLSQGSDWTFLGATPGGTITFTRQGLPATPVPFTFVRRVSGTGASTGRVSAGGQADDATFVPGDGTWSTTLG